MDLEVEKVKVAELDPTKPHMVSIEVGDTPREQVLEFCNHVKKKLEEMGLTNFVIIPCKDGVPSVKFTEVKDPSDLEKLK